MRKTNHYFKRKKFFKSLLSWLLVDIFILLLFLGCAYESRPIDLSTAQENFVLVEEIEYKRVYSEYRLSIYSGGKKYQFPNLGAFSEYTIRELYDKIQCGDGILIKYVEQPSIFGTENLIIDAKTETTEYLDENEYTSQKEGVFVFVIVLFGIVECLFFALLVVYVLFNKKDLKLFSRKKKQITKR